MSAAVQNQPRVRAFVTTGEASEMLLFAGFTVCLMQVNNQKMLVANGQPVVAGYRDGTNWKFKRDTVQDFIDENAL